VTFSLEQEVSVLVALRHADVVDRCSSAGDAVGFARASAQMLSVVDRLPVRPVVEGAGGGGSGDGSGERGRVLSILDGPPTVGDAADA
tara:strand:+ start:219 stop:482 length:264 start_codon:yes stop_codon:yes gene_type:complete